MCRHNKSRLLGHRGGITQIGWGHRLLTDKQCRAATREGGKAKLFDGNGLYLEILRSDAKSWRWQYRLDGKERRLTFGLYPTVSLKDARIESEKAAALLRTGVDPAIDCSGRAAMTQADAEPTFQEVALDWQPTGSSGIPAALG